MKLIALLDGRIAGHIYQASGTYRFEYDREWQEDEQAYPLSLSMPLSAQSHEHRVINSFLWGLLPDNERILDEYGRLFRVSAANPVALLSHIGADCAGAVQFATPENVASLLESSAQKSDIEELTESDVAEELRTVRQQRIPGSRSRTSGRFSLSGAQPKIALLEEKGKWGRPNGRIPTNRILKPPSTGFPGFAENEHMCLEIAQSLGLGAVASRVMKFEDEIAIVVDRFDRDTNGNTYRRIHQEDVCQALGVMPTQKYENAGGPGVAAIVNLLRENSQSATTDVDRFLRVVVLNWILAATDGHAKNYAILHGPRGATRLALFYDIASYLPYADSDLHRIQLAMKVGSEYLVNRIVRLDWEKLAKVVSIPINDILARVSEMLDQIPRSISEVSQHALEDGLDETFVSTFAERALARSAKCKERFEL